jgi:nitroreductase
VDIFEAIQGRHTSRNFDGTSVLKTDLEKIVDAGRLAPTGYNIQPWQFIVVTDREKIEYLSEADKWIANAGAVIMVVMDLTISDFTTEDASAAIAYMLLASTALGYGACWVEGDIVPFEAEFKETFNIPDQHRLFALVPVGNNADEPKPKEKKPLDDVLHWETL